METGVEPEESEMLASVGRKEQTRLALIKEAQQVRRRELAELAKVYALEARKRQRLEDRLARIPNHELLAVAGQRVLTAAAKAARASAKAAAKAAGKAKAKAKAKAPCTGGAESEVPGDDDEEGEE